MQGSIGSRALLALTLAAATAGTAAATVLFRYDPAKFGFYPRCLLFVYTGIYCPGCGALRAMHQLVHGNLLGALDYNPLLVLASPFLVYWVLAHALRLTTGRGLPIPYVPGRVGWAIAGTVISFMVLRNLPFAPFTVLAP